MIDVLKLINLRNFNEWTIISSIVMIAGLVFWIGWGVTYGVWMDIGVYAFSAFLFLGGFFGFLLSLAPKQEKN